MKSSPSPNRDEITPEHVFHNRRFFIRAGILGGSLATTGMIYRAIRAPALRELDTEEIAISGADVPVGSGFVTDEPRTPVTDVTNYNNFYEFSTNKDRVADVAAGFDMTNWKVEVGGLAHQPKTFDLEDLLKIAPPEERIYRMRCVEGWSMVIPWVGYSLSKLLDRVQPMGSAKYVAFETIFAPERMPGQKTDVLPWPYVEGLRIDEAMHPLTLLASGLYGRALPPQNGGPLRLVVPWKYGFKGIKSIVRITLVDEEPLATWNAQAPDEYGFYANVNPEVDHPRWSQATEMRIGEPGRRPTLMFNGYAEQVAGLYAGMDLRKYF